VPDLVSVMSLSFI